MIKVIHKALAILEWIAEEPELLRPLSAIARRFNMHPATCAHIVKTLVTAGYLEKGGEARGYILGPMAFRLARRGPYRKDLVRVAEPLLAALARDTRESVVLSTMHNGRKLILCSVGGNRDVQVNGVLILDDNIYQTATGRVLLAFLPEPDRQAIVASHGLPGNNWPAARTAVDLRQELDSIRKAGRVIHAPTPDVVFVAVPVMESGRVIAALGISLLAMHFKKTHKKKLLTALDRTARELGAALGSITPNNRNMP